MYNNGEKERNKIKEMMQKQSASNTKGKYENEIKEFFCEQNSIECYKMIIKLIKKFPQVEYLKQNKKLGSILVKIIIRYKYQ